MNAAIRLVDAPAAMRGDFAAFLRAHGVDGEDLDTLVGVGAERVLVYRALVHNRLRSATREFIPRTAARRNKPEFRADFDAFMQAHASQSFFLRDVPGEFVEWVRPRWADDPAVPKYLGDLARHELLETEVRNDPLDDEAPSGVAIDLELPLRFGGAARLMKYDWAVHKLPIDIDDRSDPAEAPTHLLVYRDETVKVRYLELTGWATAVLEQLLVQRKPVREGLLAAAASLDEPLDDDKLARAATLFAELGDHAVLLGAEPTR
ncbi:MAG TPA: putative DNA-binding domain-containing protein [Nannocystaceae bacterium]|nr:putative DNA-binding domain-containing protein [Nannocystaceae bacterium]